jgi:DNA-binding MarR family transcriptional regulator
VGLDEITDALEAIAAGSVAMTNAALEQAGGHALSVEQWRAILLVGEDGDDRRISEIARSVSVTVPATSRLLRRLAVRGLVSLDPDPRDARATICRLTDRGSALRRAVVDHRRRLLRGIAARVGASRASAAAITRLGHAFGELDMTSTD